MTTSTRRLEILRAIVDEYVATQEPVGSKAIADRHELGVSPATIRNEMALLEEEGLITAPHTSAGGSPASPPALSSAGAPARGNRLVVPCGRRLPVDPRMRAP